MATLITGASSGLGAALALRCARDGAVLHLSGRDAARLGAVATSCRERGATVHEAVLDVTDAAAMQRWIAGAGELRLVIANAGISAGTGTAVEPAEQVRAIFETNVTGVLNTVLPAVAAMAAQPPGDDGLCGRVAVISSIAAFVAAPGAPAYCATKAAVRHWAEAMDSSERRRGIRVHAICPGYVRTPMTAANAFPMPFLLEPDDAARRVLAGIARGQVRVAFPWPLYLGARFAGALPPSWQRALLGWAPAKAAG